MSEYGDKIDAIRTRVKKELKVRIIPMQVDYKKNPFAVRNIMLSINNYYCGFAELQVKACKLDAYPDFFIPKRLMDGGLKLIKNLGMVVEKKEPAFVLFFQFADCLAYAPFRKANPAWMTKSLSSDKAGPYEAYVVPISVFKKMEEKV